MSAMTDLKCPKCMGPMRHLERSGVTVDRCSECGGIEVRPCGFDEIQLRVRALPEQEVTQSLLASRANQQVDVARSPRAMIHLREQLREGWVRAWTKFYSYSSIWSRFTVRMPGKDTPGSSLIPTLGYFPINFMQHHFTTQKIAGGLQRFRTGLIPSMGDMAEASVQNGGFVSPTSVGNPGIQMPSNPFARRKSDDKKSLIVIP